MKTFLVSFLILLSIYYSHADRFSALEELVTLSENEEKIVEHTVHLIQKLEEFAAKIKSDLKQNEKELKFMQNDSFRYISNPLNAFLIIKRLSYDVSQIIQQIYGIAEAFDTRTKQVRLPLSEFEGAVEGLVRLQIMYNLNPEDLAKGIIEDKKYRDDLTASELYVLAKELMRTNRSIVSLSYLNLAYERNQQQQEMSDVTILELILENQRLNRDNKAMIDTLDEILKIAPERSDLEDLRMNLELKEVFSEDPIKVETLDRTEKKNGNFSQLKELMMLIAACGGKQEKNFKKLSMLKCRLHSTNSFSRLAPFKVEEVHLNPYIAIYHDVISENEIEAFKKLSKSNLSRAQVLNKDSSTRTSNVRVAKYSWHSDTNDKVFESLTKRVGDMSGLNMKTSEAWQTQNYGIGGHYDAHHDFILDDATPFSTGTGNRIATALFYLSDVEKGGATVFPYIDVTLYPKKGSAAFWYNLSTSGHHEYLTRHSGCPVLVGSKWVANKWLHEHGQEWTRPCNLEPVITDKFYYKKFFENL